MTNPQSAIRNPQSIDDVTIWGERVLRCGDDCPFFGVDERRRGWGFCCGGDPPKFGRSWPSVEAGRRANECVILRKHLQEKNQS